VRRKRNREGGPRRAVGARGGAADGAPVCHDVSVTSLRLLHVVASAGGRLVQLHRLGQAAGSSTVKTCRK
jgi:hypothetical protein